jgi:hypothetical protein
VNNSANSWPNRDAAVTGWHFSDRRCPFVHKKADVRPPLQVHGFTTLALQLLSLQASESMGNHDSEIVGAGSVD